MESKWKEYVLSDIVGMQSTKVDAEIININNFISTENMLPDKAGIRVSSGLPQQNSYLAFKKSDVLFSNIRTYFRKVWKASFDGGASNDVVVFRTKNDEILSQSFLYHLIADERFVEFTVKTAKGTKMPRGDKSAMKGYKIIIPKSIPEQKAIAKILGDLDDKIELNRQMNQTLEQMAQAMFKSWFVDFDPVFENAIASGKAIPEELKAKAEKRKAITNKKPLPKEIQKLFPDEFEYTEEMGWIPKGWKVLPLNELINVKHGFAFKGKDFSIEPTADILLTPGNFKVGGGFKGHKFKYYNGEYPESYILNNSDLIITMTDLSKEGDTLGFPAFIPFSNEVKYLHNQRLGRVEYKSNKIEKNYLYQCLCTHRYRSEILGNTSGTTVKHTSPTKIMAHNIVISENNIEQIYENNAKSLNEKIEINNINIKKLTQLRDTLLPKLISGELRVPEVLIEKE